MKARSALFTLFGDVVRPAGGEAWLSTISTCMQTLGFRREAVRTALHRMSAEGWVQPRREGRYAAYRLTDRGVARLEAAAERIYRLRSQAWDGRWRLLLAPSLTDTQVIAELEWIGYGRLQPGVWVHPHPHPAAARSLLTGIPAEVTWLEGGVAEGDAALAARAWSLADLEDSHRSFLADWQGVTVPADPEEAFAMRLRLVHRWRTFLFLDPGLPAEVLPDGWPGFTAARVFAETYEVLRTPSWAFYADAQHGAPTQVEEIALAAAASPFAQGLAALHQP